MNANATPRRYGCQEARDDLELILQGRGPVAGAAAAHLRECDDCRAFERRLRSAYRGPSLPRDLDLASLSRDFDQAAGRVNSERRRARVRRAAPATAAAAAIAAGFAALALWVNTPASAPAPSGVEAAWMVAAASLAHGEAAATERVSVDDPSQGGIGHVAQSFGRVVGGSPEVLDAAGQPTNLEALTAGTQIHVGEGEVQIAILGRLLANLLPGTDLRWVGLNADNIDLELKRGMVAIRYERLAADPILNVHTPTVTVRVVGTVFTVAVDELGRSHVAVLRGRVQVFDRLTGAHLGDVEAGTRFTPLSSTLANVGHKEVAAALPLSSELELTDIERELAIDGYIPASWVVPGLSPELDQRRIDALAEPTTAIASARRRGGAGRPPPLTRRGTEADPGRDLIERIVEDARRSRRIEIEVELDRCRALYTESSTRFRAGPCLSAFLRKYGDEPFAVEGLLLVGMLRMDYAQDHQAAAVYFERFLKRAPLHPMAEVARYRLWLAAVERGMISEALQRGRAYLDRYPHGQFVGRIVQRFPELKKEL